MKHAIYTTIAVSTFLFVLNACKKVDEEQKITLDTSALTIKGNIGETDSFKISTAGQWTITISPDNGGLNINPRSGTGPATVFVKSNFNNNTGKPQQYQINASLSQNTNLSQRINITVYPYMIPFTDMVYGGNGKDFLSTLILTSDNAVVVTGTSSSTDFPGTTPIGEEDVVVMKLNFDGKLIWSKKIGGPKKDYPTSIVEKNGKLFIVGTTDYLGNTTTKNYGGSDVAVFCLDLNGNLLWERNYGGTRDDQGLDIINTSQNELLIYGQSRSRDNDVPRINPKDSVSSDYNLWVFKINDLGQLYWSKSFGNPFSDESAYEVIETKDGGYIFTVNSYNANGDAPFNSSYQSGNAYTLKTDRNGVVLWSDAFGGNRHDLLNGSFATADGGAIMVGSSDSRDNDMASAPDSVNGFLVKYDANGNRQWKKIIGGIGSDIAGSIISLDNGKFLVSGYTTSNLLIPAETVSGGNSFLIEFDVNGNISRTETFRGKKNSVVSYVAKLPNGKLLTTGYLSSPLIPWQPTSSDFDSEGWIALIDW